MILVLIPNVLIPFHILKYQLFNQYDFYVIILINLIIIKFDQLIFNDLF